MADRKSNDPSEGSAIASDWCADLGEAVFHLNQSMSLSWLKELQNRLYFPRYGEDVAVADWLLYPKPENTTSHNKRPQQNQPLALFRLLPVAVDNCPYFPLSAP